MQTPAAAHVLNNFHTRKLGVSSQYMYAFSLEAKCDFCVNLFSSLVHVVTLYHKQWHKPSLRTRDLSVACFQMLYLFWVVLVYMSFALPLVTLVLQAMSVTTLLAPDMVYTH